LKANCAVRTTPEPLQSAVASPRTTVHHSPLNPLTVLGSRSGNISATCPSTEFLSLAGRKIASSVTSTKNSGKTEKNAQNAIIAARFADWSSENFLNVATATLSVLLLFCARSSFCKTLALMRSS
jgi:hypothetical protein